MIIKLVKKLAHKVLGYFNKLLPKYNQVLVSGAPNADSNAIAVANYISSNYDMPVFYVISNKYQDDPRNLLAPDIKIIDQHWGDRRSIFFFLKFMTSKYIFITQLPFIYFFSDRQTVTNIWHGVLYKKVGVLCGNHPVNADITVATSQHTKGMFSRAFGVPVDSVYPSGYPRNDLLLDAKEKRKQLKKGIKDLNSFKKIAIWMPTYRKMAGSDRKDGIEVGNPFYIKDFKVSYFNELLKKNNTLCLVKPHPAAPSYDSYHSLSNVRFIDDRWIPDQNISLYELLGCTDLLISDVSSVIIDYMLMDQPIICMSEDFEEYRNTRGFYFGDIENWIPSRINTNQESFFKHLEYILEHNADPSRQKRQKLKKYFFDHFEDKSTHGLVRHVLKKRNP